MAAGLWALTAGAAPAARSPACGPVNATTYAENAYVRVYRRRSSPRKPMYACSKRTGARRRLDDPSSEDTAFPAVAVNRWWVVYAHTRVDTTVEVEQVYTTVDLLDERKFRRGYAASLVDSTRADSSDPAKVGSIVVNPRGSFAWISCRTDEVFARPGPTCVSPGALDRVWRREFPGRERLLAEGRRIDPGSLRLSGERIRWTDGRATRKAKLE